jgi:hypothetical protein
VRTTDRSAVKVNTLGAHLVLAHPLGSAKADLLFWGALQNGDWGAQTHIGERLRRRGRRAAGVPLKPWLACGFSQGAATTPRHDRRRRAHRPSSRCCRRRASTRARRSTT